MASLLGEFPSEWAAMSATLADRLTVEPDAEVAAAICVAAGLAGEPSDGPVVAAVGRWRGHPDRYVHRCALIGLARTDPAPDPAALAELADCLAIPADLDWQAPEVVIANAAASALGGRRPGDVPQLADLLLARMRVRPSFQALRLLLGLTFPDGPLPDRTDFADLNRLQQDVVRAVLNTGELERGMPVERALGECNLPYHQGELVAWSSGATRRGPTR